MSRNMDWGQPLIDGLKVRKYSPRVRKWASHLSGRFACLAEELQFALWCSSENGWSWEEVRKLNENHDLLESVGTTGPQGWGGVWEVPQVRSLRLKDVGTCSRCHR